MTLKQLTIVLLLVTMAFKVNTGVIAPVTQDEGDKKSGQVAPNQGDENKVASVGDVANAINNAFWKVTGAEDGGKFADGNTTTEEQVKSW